MKMPLQESDPANDTALPLFICELTFNSIESAITDIGDLNLDLVWRSGTDRRVMHVNS
jgi:hypothetical protein